MEFDRVGFPRNPSNSAKDICYIEGQCRQPLVELNKIGNPRLDDTFPEMIDFLKRFEMTTNDANQILLYQREYELIATNGSSNYSLTNDEIVETWLEASCDWLKENLDDVVALWQTEIKRYDCLNGCGFDYYFDVSNDFREINISDENGLIGGSCDIDIGECICDSEYLIDDCRTSCPGLKGPYWNESNGEFTFEFCSGHGICDIDTQSCKCDIGFGNSDCGYKYDVFSYDSDLRLVFIFVFGAIIILYVGSLLWLKSKLQYAV